MTPGSGRQFHHLSLRRDAVCAERRNNHATRGDCGAKRCHRYSENLDQTKALNGELLRCVTIKKCSTHSYVLSFLLTGTGKWLCYQVPVLMRYEVTGGLDIMGPRHRSRPNSFATGRSRYQSRSRQVTLTRLYGYQATLGVRWCRSTRDPAAYRAIAGSAMRHAGVGQKWWPGPDACMALSTDVQTTDELPDAITDATLFRCEKVLESLLNHSIAGWVLLSVSVLTALPGAALAQSWELVQRRVCDGPDEGTRHTLLAI